MLSARAGDGPRGVGERPRRRVPALAALALAALALALSAGLVLGAPGDLDTSFDGDGKRTIDYAGADSGQAVALQPDGKILVAGYGGSNTAMTVTRLNPDGSLDNSFDGDGTAGVDLGGDERAYALALQPDGKIVLVGETCPPIGFGPRHRRRPAQPRRLPRRRLQRQRREAHRLRAQLRPRPRRRPPARRQDRRRRLQRRWDRPRR